MNLSEMLILMLATWRIASLLQYERGPLAIFSRLRTLAGIEHDEDGEPMSWPDTEVARLLRCPWCGTVWVGAGLVGLYLWQGHLASILALPFALSAAAVALEGWTHGKSEH